MRKCNICGHPMAAHSIDGCKYCSCTMVGDANYKEDRIKINYSEDVYWEGEQS